MVGPRCRFSLIITNEGCWQYFLHFRSSIGMLTMTKQIWRVLAFQIYTGPCLNTFIFRWQSDQQILPWKALGEIYDWPVGTQRCSCHFWHGLHNTYLAPVPSFLSNENIVNSVFHPSSSFSLMTLQDVINNVTRPTGSFHGFLAYRWSCRVFFRWYGIQDTKIISDPPMMMIPGVLESTGPWAVGLPCIVVLQSCQWFCFFLLHVVVRGLLFQAGTVSVEM